MLSIAKKRPHNILRDECLSDAVPVCPLILPKVRHRDGSDAGDRLGVFHGRTSWGRRTAQVAPRKKRSPPSIEREVGFSS